MSVNALVCDPKNEFRPVSVERLGARSRIAPPERPEIHAARRLFFGFALFFVTLITMETVVAQSNPTSPNAPPPTEPQPSSPPEAAYGVGTNKFQERVDAAARTLHDNPQFKHLSLRYLQGHVELVSVVKPADLAGLVADGGDPGRTLPGKQIQEVRKNVGQKESQGFIRLSARSVPPGRTNLRGRLPSVRSRGTAVATTTQQSSPIPATAARVAKMTREKPTKSVRAEAAGEGGGQRISHHPAP
jgi:hypothetical protein